MNSNYVITNDNNLYRMGVNPSLMGMNTQFSNMNTQFSNMNTNENNNNLLTEQTFQKYNVIPNPGLKSSYINKPYKLVLYKNIIADTDYSNVFIFNETLRDIVSIKLLNCFVQTTINGNSNYYSFLLLNFEELKKNKSTIDSGKFIDSFACIDYDVNSKKGSTYNGIIYKNDGTYEDIKYFDPPLHSLSELTYSLYGNGTLGESGEGNVTGSYIIKIELLVETKEKLRVY